MSRIGKKLINLPAGVTVNVTNGLILVKGPKGELKRPLDPRIQVKNENNVVSLTVNDPTIKKENSLWGTYGAHLANMVKGVTEGFQKDLEINGVGFKVAMQGKDIKLEVGYSHSVIFKMPEGATATVEKNLIKIVGIDKEIVGQTAAQIRAIKKPEPYKGKGIKYSTEVIRRKAGKAATKSAS
jgi:large subunit ribosomal protein L6